MRIELDIDNEENFVPFSARDLTQIRLILHALIQTGGLTRVKGGQTIIHFDHLGDFQKIELKYFPWSHTNDKIRGRYEGRSPADPTSYKD